MKIKAGIVGATGYAGAELVRLLTAHPEAEISAISSVSFEGDKLSDVYPSYTFLNDMVCENQDAVVEKSDVIFAALPHGLSQELAAKCIDAGKAFIDLGADFRLESEEEYTEWYGGTFLDKKLHEQAVYGLPEFFRDKIKGKKLVANPGCYTTCSFATAKAVLRVPAESQIRATTIRNSTKDSTLIRLQATATLPKLSRLFQSFRAKRLLSPLFRTFSP